MGTRGLPQLVNCGRHRPARKEGACGNRDDPDSRDPVPPQAGTGRGVSSCAALQPLISRLRRAGAGGRWRHAAAQFCLQPLVELVSHLEHRASAGGEEAGLVGASGPTPQPVRC